MRENNSWAGCFLFPSIHWQCIWHDSRQKKFKYNRLVKWGSRIWMSLPPPGASGLGNQTNVGQPYRVCFHPKNQVLWYLLEIECLEVSIWNKQAKRQACSLDWAYLLYIVAWDRRWRLECCIDTKKKAYPSWQRALYHFHVYRGRLALCLPLMRRWENWDFFHF